MASLVSNCAAIVKSRVRDEVFVATMPLTASKGPPHLLMNVAYSLNFWSLQHFMVIIKHHSSSSSSSSQVMVFDFQPKDPQDIYVALEVLSGRAVPGTLLVRKLKTLPRSKCWLVGHSKGDAVEIATEFNKKWETSLRVGLNDCRHYTNGKNLLESSTSCCKSSTMEEFGASLCVCVLIYTLMVNLKGLVEQLTGEKDVLNRLKNNHS